MTLSLCGQAYHVGDLYTAPDGSQGIVYFVLPDGSGGWVVALNDASTGCKWGDALDIPEIPDLMYGIFTYQQANFDTAGYQKTALIRAFQNNSQTYAAGKVDFANGWYLPSPGQLSILFAQRPVINEAILNAGGSLMATGWYWTSSESDYQNACAVHFGGSGSNARGDFRFNQNKSVNCYVRAVRSFSYGNEPVSVSYLWNTGDTTPDITVNLTQTTTYTVTVTTSNGCADTVSHTIVLFNRDTLTFNETACEEFEWNGQMYTASGDYTFTYPMPGGCDSVVILHLTVDHTPQATISVSADTICEGNEVTLQATATGTTPITYLQPIAIGDILCTDNSIVKPSAWPVAGKTALGVVFYVDNTGEHGFAVHLHEQQINLRWSTVLRDITGLVNYSKPRTAITDFDGYGNTQIIRSDGNAEEYPVAYAVDFDNGWYLPALGQATILVTEINDINPTLQIVGGTQFPSTIYSVYHTSTEYSKQDAWNVASTGYVMNHNKRFLWNPNFRIRSVRSF